MGLINDTKFNVLGGLGFTGTVQERETQWLQSIGATSDDINDAWRQIAGSPGNVTEDRWIINAGTVTRIDFPADWTPTTANWQLRLNAQAAGPAALTSRTLVLAFASGNSTVNDGIFMGYNSSADAYSIQVHSNFGQTVFNDLINFGEEVTAFQVDMVLASNGQIITNATPAPTDSFDPLVFASPNFVYSNFSAISSVIFVDFVDLDDESNSRRYDFTVASATMPPAQTTFLDQNAANGATLSGANATPWRLVSIEVPGTGAGGDDINQIKRNYFLANGGTGNHINDIELSFWESL